MEETSKKRMLIVAFVWCCILGVIALAYHFWWAPKKQKVVEQQMVEEKDRIVNQTSAAPRYTSTIKFALDSFSGYAPIRSTMFRDECSRFGIRLELVDDGANYQTRLQGLADGKIDMAVFTIDALIKASVEMKDFPATIVALTDESRGADAVLADKKVFPNIDSLNDPNTRIVCVGNSPSETLGRVCMAYFNLDRLSPTPFDFTDSPEATYKIYQQARPSDKKVFILWEPYVSRVKENPDYQVLIDSSKSRGYIVDVIVVSRGFLIKNDHVVEQVLKSYLITIFNHRNNMVDLVSNDANQIGTPLKKSQAEGLCNSIWWKNTQENFSHFGLTTGHGTQHIEEMCRNITDVLVRTQSIRSDPVNGQFNKWYYDGIMRRLFDSNWHPGFVQESVRQEKSLLTLNDEEWKKLRPVGTLQVPRLVFARGTSNLTPASENTLVFLSEQLKNWPQYYLIVRGNASKEGNVEANMKLAETRANSAVEWLIRHGVDRNRIHREVGGTNGSTTVAFLLGEIPY